MSKTTGLERGKQFKSKLHLTAPLFQTFPGTHDPWPGIQALGPDIQGLRDLALLRQCSPFPVPLLTLQQQQSTGHPCPEALLPPGLSFQPSCLPASCLFLFKDSIQV